MKTFTAVIRWVLNTTFAIRSRGGLPNKALQLASALRRRRGAEVKVFRVK